ncbi:hypothetical protein GF377_07865, partial [candidate division GN15 bacterium]|nr:hypothetical protein [candidate division GN15 bacterium]
MLRNIRRTGRSALLMLFLGLALAVLTLLQMPIANEQPSLTNAEKIEQSALCLDCHDGDHLSLSGTVHQLADEPKSPNVSQVTCIDC